MKKSLCATFLFVLLFAAVGCGAVNAVKSLTGDDALSKTSELWSDVPRMDGMTTSEMEMPVFGKLLMRTALNTTGEGKDTGDWVVFSTTKTTDDLKNFYTNERMTSFGGWEPSKNSTCLSGSDQGFPQVGVFCVFGKNTNNTQVGLMILGWQDDKSNPTNILFVRVEELATPVANKPPTAAAQAQPATGEIKLLNGAAPYGIEKRPMPSGLDINQLLPKQVGPYTRASVELSTNQGVPATSVEIDGNSLYAHYRSGGTEIFVEFAVNGSAANAQMTLDTAASETTGKFPTDPRFGSIGTEPGYLKVNDENGSFFAWTRGGYYYSASAKDGAAALDAFMQAFPY